MDLKEIEENIKNYSNEKLITEGIIKADDYIPEVKELFNKEIEARKISQEEINTIKEKNEISKNTKIQKQSNKLRGVLLLISISLLIDFFVYLLVGFFAIRNYMYIGSILFFAISIFSLLSFILILCRKKIAKKIFVIFIGICILISVIDIIISIINNSFALETIALESIAKTMYVILKNSLCIMYFVKSDYVKNYLIK